MLEIPERLRLRLYVCLFKADASLVSDLFHALLTINSRKGDLRLFISQDESRNGPLFAAFVPSRPLLNFAQIRVLEHG